jgi:hypothetical protein
MPLTDAAIVNAKPKARAYKLADGAGMYLLVRPGGAKYWRLKYHYAGKEKLVSLGVYPEVSLTQARSARDWARGVLESGNNPSDVKRGARERPRAAGTGVRMTLGTKGALTIKTPSLIVRLAGPQTDALRELLLGNKPLEAKC